MPTAERPPPPPNPQMGQDVFLFLLWCLVYFLFMGRHTQNLETFLPRGAGARRAGTRAHSGTRGARRPPTTAPAHSKKVPRQAKNHKRRPDKHHQQPAVTNKPAPQPFSSSPSPHPHPISAAPWRPHPHKTPPPTPDGQRSHPAVSGHPSRDPGRPPTTPRPTATAGAHAATPKRRARQQLPRQTQT